MPIYEYRCEDCAERFEHLAVSYSADGAACPSCGSRSTRRLLSVIAGVGGRAEPPPPVCGGGACAACS